MYAAFFCELEEARKEIGNEKFADWCLFELGIGLSVLTDVMGVLKKEDAARVKAEFVQARHQEREKKRHEAEERELERARILREKAAIDAERVKLEAETDRLARRTEKNANDRRRRSEKSEEQRARESAARKARNRAQKAREANGPTISIDLDDVAMRLRNGHSLAESGTANWIDGSIQAALALVEGKQAFSSAVLFGQWLEKSWLDFYNKNDRAALINLGRDPIKMREILMKEDGRSYDLIWRRHKSGYPPSENSEGNIIPLRTA